ncbi:MAG: hypothetical protein QOE01_1934 [Actinomycetota bacterium]|jgi:hypothetical protein|nr:hypothetical protein [Actinomycetota bacterium]
MDEQLTPLSKAELDAEKATPLPDKEVMSLLDLNVNLDLALDLAAPIDLAVAANANVAAPIDAAVGANVLSVDSTAGALAGQHVALEQNLSGDAVANAPQDSAITQSADPTAGTTDPTAGTTDPTAGADLGSTTSSLLDGNLLNVDVNANADANITAPVDGAVAANANVAAPIDAAVSANIGSVGSDATAIANQDATISQNMDGVTADATADQTSNINQ